MKMVVLADKIAMLKIYAYACRWDGDGFDSRFKPLIS